MGSRVGAARLLASPCAGAAAAVLLAVAPACARVGYGDAGGAGGTAGGTRSSIVAALPSSALALDDLTIRVPIGEPEFAMDAMRPDGSDLRFLDADDHPLPFELEGWRPGVGGDAWVRLPRLGAGAAGTTLWAAYGAEAPPPLSAESAWSPVHVAVWHFGPGLTDSSGRGNTAVLRGALVEAGAAGAIASALSLNDAADAGADAADSASLQTLASGFTVSAWFQLAQTALPLSWHCIIARQFDSGISDDFYLGIEAGNLVAYVTDVAGEEHLVSDVEPVVVGTWYHAAMTWDGSVLRLFVDGRQVAASDPLPLPCGSSPNPVTLGADYEDTAAAQDQFAGLIDEVRIETAVRPQAWMAVQRASLAGTLVQVEQP